MTPSKQAQVNWGKDMIQDKVLECILAKKRFDELADEIRIITDRKISFCADEHRVQLGKGIEEVAKIFGEDTDAKTIRIGDKQCYEYSAEIIGMTVIQLEEKI